MRRPNSAILFGFFVAIIVAMCGASLFMGGLYLSKHEGDTVHLLQIVFRMAEGQWPHLDFMTPIGVLAFAPITLFVTLGFGVGMAFILAQAFVAIVFLPAIWWSASSRMTGVLPYVFGLFVIVLISALVHGETSQSVSVSMHYNRWAWAATFIAITLALLPPNGTARPTVDGMIIGLCMAALLLTKVTYFAAFAGPILIAMLLRQTYRGLAVAILTGLVVAGAVTLWAGPQFWAAYLSDILRVAGSDVRPYPGVDLGAIVGAPAYLGGSLVLLGGVVLLRQAQQAIAGLVLLLLVPGFIFVTYQNFGNDPQWLLLLAVLLIASQPAPGLRNGFGWDMRGALKVAGAVAIALAAPSFFNLAYSPFRHLGVNTADYAAFLPGSGRHQDMKTWAIRAHRVNALIAMDGPESGLSAYAARAERNPPARIRGEDLPRCEVELGLLAWFDTISKDLDQAGLAAGKQLFAADIIASHWLYGPLQPLEQGAPWYYGGLPGFDNADYVLVPLCPISKDVRGKILKTIAESDVALTEIRRTPLYLLYAKGGAGG